MKKMPMKKKKEESDRNGRDVRARWEAYMVMLVYDSVRNRRYASEAFGIVFSCLHG